MFSGLSARLWFTGLGLGGGTSLKCSDSFVRSDVVVSEAERAVKWTVTTGKWLMYVDRFYKSSVLKY
ncbi:hypothetical protein TNCV_1213861 [Trichonephila clavipes]|nr:hypothetical protein TNCV_1213861 [Trichonephila clavipes]